MWRNIDMYNLGEDEEMDYDMQIMCRHAVDRSNGQLEYINIEFFCNDQLLNYIANRSNSLKHLRLANCYYITDDGMSVVAGKLPLLEELEVSLCYNISELALKVFGRCCPLLKTLKFNTVPSRKSQVDRCNREALSIAKNMHGLHHLQLFFSEMTNVGLEAILDGCPNLESLDLRRCFKINLKGRLGKRCTEQIKILRRPYDRTYAYEFNSGYRYAYPSDSPRIRVLGEPESFSDDDDFDYYPGVAALYGPLVTAFHALPEDDDFFGYSDSEDEFEDDDSDVEDDFEDDDSDEDDDCDEESSGGNYSDHD